MYRVPIDLEKSVFISSGISLFLHQNSLYRIVFIFGIYVYVINKCCRNMNVKD